MTNKIKLANCHQQFAIENQETILEAAIRAGISLNYGCSSGTCGLCKARLVEGRVSEVRVPEFVLTEAEKLQGYFLTCLNTTSEDVVMDALIAGSGKEIPLQEIIVKVRKIEYVADQVYRIVLQTPRTKRLRFLAGQYVELISERAGSAQFAIASCPCEDRLIEFHLRVLEGDPFTSFVQNGLKVGDTLKVKGPYGEFGYDDQVQRPVILFAFDTGFAAIKSLLEHITAQEKETSIKLIWMSCGQEGLYMNNLCRSWNDAFDLFSYQGIALDSSFKELVSDPQQGRATVESYIRQALAEYDDLSGYDVYTSAPLPAMELFKSVCVDKKMLNPRFFSEPIRGNENMSCILPLVE